MTSGHGFQILMLLRASPFFLGAGDPPELPEITTSTAIGIATAVTGNILISLALNLQKLAHRRVEAGILEGKDGRNGGVNRRRMRKPGRVDPSLNERDEDQAADLVDGPAASAQATGAVDTMLADGGSVCGSPTQLTSSESQQLLPFPIAASDGSVNSTPNYGVVAHSGKSGSKKRLGVRRFTTRIFHVARRSMFIGGKETQIDTLPVQVITAESNSSLHHNPTSDRAGSGSCNVNGELVDQNEGEYLKSKLWWFGFALMNFGELGNFISYAFAPASVVAPLGTFALVANCFFSPIILRERFRKRDLLGVLVAIVGAVTVVLASNSSDIRLDPDGLIKAILQKPFIIYTITYIIGAIILSFLSHGSYGRKWVLIDVGLCALFGGFTVLSTKALSTLLTLQWIEIFKSWITYPVVLVLFGTGVGQVRYLNRALMRFDSKVVIPSQFVFFNLSVILGSAILYGDFKRATFHQMVTFLYGCAATFAGVFIIAWAPSSSDAPDSESQVGDEGTRANSVSDSILPISGSPIARRRATLVLPTAANPAPIIRHQHSSLSLMGLSPAQNLLLVHTPPRDTIDTSEMGPDHDPFSTPGSFHRRRAVSWYEGRDTAPRTRDSSVTGHR